MSFRERLDVSFEKCGFFDAAGVVGGMEMDDVDPDAGNAAAEQSVVEAFAQELHVGDGVAGSDACGEAVGFEQHGVCVSPGGGVSGEFFGGVLVEFLERCDVGGLGGHPAFPVAVAGFAAFCEAVEDVVGDNSECRRGRVSSNSLLCLGRTGGKECDGNGDQEQGAKGGGWTAHGWPFEWCCVVVRCLGRGSEGGAFAGRFFE